MTPLHAGAVVFGRTLVLLAGATVVFLLANAAQTVGLCGRDRSAADAFVLATGVTFLGLAGVLLSVLRRRYRGVRAAALAGWATSLLPALLLVLVARTYVGSIAPGC